MTGEEHLKRARDPMTTPIDELAGIEPLTAEEALRKYGRHERGCAIYMPTDGNCSCGFLATLDAARSTPVPASTEYGDSTPTRHRSDTLGPCLACRHRDAALAGVSEGLREAVGDIIGRMSSATRTMDTEVREAPNGVIASWGATLRAALAHAAPEGLDGRDIGLASIVRQYLRLDDALPDVKPDTMSMDVWDARVREVRNARAGVEAFLAEYEAGR